MQLNCSFELRSETLPFPFFAEAILQKQLVTVNKYVKKFQTQLEDVKPSATRRCHIGQFFFIALQPPSLQFISLNM